MFLHAGGTDTPGADAIVSATVEQIWAVVGKRF